MKIQIGMLNDGESIACVKEYHPIKDKGEIAHFLAEVSIIQQELIELWDEYNEDEKTT